MRGCPLHNTFTARHRSLHEFTRFAGHSAPHEPSGPALPLIRLSGVEARRPACAGPARVRDAAGGGPCAGQAAGHGLRDDHRPRHDRGRARDRRPARRVHLGGADRALPRRAAGGARAVPRDHAGPPRVAAGARRRRRDRRRVPARARDRLCARAPVLRRRRAADRAPPAPARRAVPDLGGPQRRPLARAEPAGRDLRRHARLRRHRRLRRPRGHRHRAHVDRDAGRRDAGGLPRPRPRRPRRRVRRPGLGRQVGARGDGARRARARPRRRRRAARSGRRAPDRRARDGGGRRALRPGWRRRRAGGRAGAIARWLDAVELDVDGRELLSHLQATGFSHAGLERRARRCHERKLAAAVVLAGAEAANGAEADWNAVAAGVFEACVAAVPYAPAAAFLAREKDRVRPRQRAGPRRAGGRRARRGARRRQHDRPGPGARRARVRRRGDRHRRVRRPAPERGRRGRDPVLSRADDRDPRPPGGRRRARRRALRAAARVLARPGGRGRAAHRAPARAAGRRLVPHRARRLRRAEDRRSGGGRRDADGAGGVLRPVPRPFSPRPMPRTPPSASSGSTPRGSVAGTAAST